LRLGWTYNEYHHFGNAFTLAAILFGIQYAIKIYTVRQFKFLLLLFLILKVQLSNAQNAQIPGWQPDFIKLTGEVKLIDSQYILITKLSITSNEEIKVAKWRYFTQGEWTTAKNRLSLQRNVRGFFVHISIDVLRQPLYNEDWDKELKVDQAHPLFDTINLGDHYPFEIGNYSIIAEIDYSYKAKKYLAQSPAIMFDVLYLPKRPIFN